MTLTQILAQLSDDVDAKPVEDLYRLGKSTIDDLMDALLQWGVAYETGPVGLTAQKYAVLSMEPDSTIVKALLSDALTEADTVLSDDTLTEIYERYWV